MEQFDANAPLSGSAVRQSFIQVRFWLARGELARARRWADDSGLSLEDSLTYQSEGDLLILARVWIAGAYSGPAAGTGPGSIKNKERSADDEGLQQAQTLLARLLDTVEAEGRGGRAIEILALQALARQAQGQTQLALDSLQQALILAEPEGYVRVFVDEGSPMAALLYEAAAQGLAPEYVGRLLALFPPAEPEPSRDRDPQSDQTPIVEPLTRRELEVLQLIADGHSNREIAQQLVLTPGTVKVHTRNIYGKLGVNSRTQAVAKAKTLAIL